VADITGPLTEKVKISKGTGLEVWVSGDFSKMAHSKLGGMGWKVHKKARSQLIPAEK